MNIMKKNNPCGFDKCICRQNLKYGCCRCCLHVGNEGCMTENLSCKFFFCSKAKTECKIVLQPKDIKILNVLPYRCQVIVRHDYFTKEEDFLMDLYIGSVTIFCIRFIYRFIRDRIKRKRNKKRIEIIKQK